MGMHVLKKFQKMFLLVALLSWLAVGNSQAEVQNLKLFYHNPQNHSELSQITFRIPYTLGTHHGLPEEVAGNLNVDPDAIENLTGKFVIPVKSIKTGNPLRDCHLLEAMGLNYSQSAFPTEHVCDKKNQITDEELINLSFPTVEFEVKSAKIVKEKKVDDKQYAKLEITGEWNIHGQKIVKTHSIDWEAKTLDHGINQAMTVRVKGDLELSLKEFGIIVKSSKVLGLINIGVKDKVKVKLNLLFK
jgi:polyisoprenoid-binding protein YceI